MSYIDDKERERSEDAFNKLLDKINEELEKEEEEES